MNAKRHTLTNALRAAAKVYDDAEHTFSCIPNHERTAQAFADQSREALALAEQIEQADVVELED